MESLQYLLVVLLEPLSPPPPPSLLKDPPMDYIYTTLTKGSRPHTHEGCQVMLTAVMFSGITSISSGSALGTPVPPPHSPLKDPPMDYIYTTLTKGSRPHTQEGCHVMLTAVLFSGITSISSGGALGSTSRLNKIKIQISFFQ